MKSLKSLAFATLSFVAVSGVQADEPVKAQPQQTTPNQAALPQKPAVASSRHHRWQVVKQPAQAVQSSSSQQHLPSSAGSPPSKLSEPAPSTTAVSQSVAEAPHRSLLSRLRGYRSRNSSAISISQATAPAPAGSASQPLPNAK